MSRHRPEEYEVLRKWHLDTGTTDPEYIVRLQRRAASSGQPLDVTFEHYERPGEWARASALHKHHAFRVHNPQFDKLLKEIQ